MLNEVNAEEEEECLCHLPVIIERKKKKMRERKDVQVRHFNGV